MAVEVGGRAVNYDSIPGGSPYMRRAVENWVEYGVLDPDGFLHAVVTNNLKMAVLRADDENVKLLPEWVSWFRWEVPGNCWGSVEIARDWAATRGEACGDCDGTGAANG